MCTPFPAVLVEKIAYPVCILSIVVFVPLAVAAVWLEWENETLLKLLASSAIIGFSSAIAFSATRAVKGPE